MSSTVYIGNPDPRMLRIVLVEDNPADAQMFQMALRRAGKPVELTILEDGHAALEHLTGVAAQNSSFPCDLVLLDLNLPVVSGFEVLEQIRSHPLLNPLPVVVMSGSSNIGEIERCYRAGANSYICKPGHFEEILATASELMAYWSHCVKLPSRRPSALASTSVT